jgi:hypothetical protein
LVAPYKRPERDLRENEEFNKHVSMVRIRSEHAIGFLKGRFKSLKGLRVCINDEKSHRFATYWVAACVIAHNFAIDCEQEEASSSDSDTGTQDSMIDDGLSPHESTSSSSPSSITDESESETDRTHHLGRLTAARQHREELKQALFEFKYPPAATSTSTDHSSNTSSDTGMDEAQMIDSV